MTTKGILITEPVSLQASVTRGESGNACEYQYEFDIQDLQKLKVRIKNKKLYLTITGDWENEAFLKAFNSLNQNL